MTPAEEKLERIEKFIKETFPEDDTEIVIAVSLPAPVEDDPNRKEAGLLLKASKYFIQETIIVLVKHSNMTPLAPLPQDIFSPNLKRKDIN